MSTYYAILGPDRMPCHGGSGQWPSPGEWREEAGPLRVGRPGTLHLLLVEDVPHWVVCPGEVWIAEASGPVEVANDKVGVLRARLVRRVGSLTPSVLAAWAEECASRASDSAKALTTIQYAHANLIAKEASQDASLASRSAVGAVEAHASKTTDFDQDTALYASWAAETAAACVSLSYDDPAGAERAERHRQGERLLALLAQHEEDR